MLCTSSTCITLCTGSIQPTTSSADHKYCASTRLSTSTRPIEEVTHIVKPKLNQDHFNEDFFETPHPTPWHALYKRSLIEGFSTRKYKSPQFNGIRKLPTPVGYSSTRVLLPLLSWYVLEELESLDVHWFRHHDVWMMGLLVCVKSRPVNIVLIVDRKYRLRVLGWFSIIESSFKNLVLIYDKNLSIG